MVQRRTPRPSQRVVPHVFDIPLGVEDLVYDDDSEELDDESDVDDYDEEPQDKTKKKKKKKKKKRKKRKKKKGKKKKNKGKGKKKKDKGKKDKGGPVKDKGPNTPSSLEVVKQVIRTKNDGSQVVDLTVDVDKIGRADKYEFRVTKKDTGKTTVVGG
jgi:hypothetical protein